MPAIGVLITCEEGGENSHDVRLESALPRSKVHESLIGWKRDLILFDTFSSWITLLVYRFKT